MALTDNGGLSAADVAAVTGNNGFGGFGGDGAWWLLVLFLFAMNGNWSGNGFSNGAGAVPFMMGQNDVQRGFDQSAIMNGITGLSAGLANAEVSRCNAQTNILQAITNSQFASAQNSNALAMSLQNCCCENRAAVADLKYTISNEAAASRAAAQANTQAILDKLCQQEIDALKTQNANLQTQINLANLRETQTAQTAAILADNAAQTAVLRQSLNPTPIPAYVVQNPSCCNNLFGSCGA